MIKRFLVTIISANKVYTSLALTMGAFNRPGCLVLAIN